MNQSPLKYARFHAKQEQASEALLNHMLVALFWGNRVGKTEWGAQTVAKIALGEHEVITPGEMWSFCPSFDEQKDTTQKKLLKYLPENKIIDKTWIRKGILKEITVDAGQGRISKISFKSYEQGREKAQGAGKVLIWFDEEPPKDIFEECFVRQEAGITLRIIMTMTPIKGMTWVYDEIYLKTGNPDYFVSEATWNDNPWLTNEQKDVMSRGLSENALKVRREGKFIKMTGLVCPWFSRTMHVVDITSLPEGDTYFSLDFGFNAPACGIWGRLDFDHNLWLFDGFYERGLITPMIAEKIRVKEGGMGIVHRIGDSAQAADIKQLSEAGIAIEGVKKETGTDKENWDEFRARLMAEYGMPSHVTGKPRIFISSKLLALDAESGEPYNFVVKEIERLRWDEAKDESGTKSLARWGPQAKHAIDSISYMLAFIRGPAGPVDENLDLYTQSFA